MKEESKFLEVRCQDCENEQIIFSKASNPIECQICGRTLATPTGGKSEIKAKVVKRVDE